MILVDTSVWIDHFREGLQPLSELLETNSVLMHPFVLGELACVNLRSRQETLRLLGNLPVAPRASDSEVFQFIKNSVENPIRKVGEEYRSYVGLHNL